MKYEMPQYGVTLRTNATRRFLIASVTDRRAKVECSTNDENAAQRLIDQTRAQMADQARTKVYLIDQALRGGQ
jgi:hypothetical protein